MSTPKELAVAAIEEKKRREARKDCKKFVSGFLKTFDPRPEAYPHHLDFHLYPYEEELIDELLNAIWKGYDLFIEKSRDMGVSWTILAVFLWLWGEGEGFQSLIGSRKEDYVDNGDIDSLFGKIEYMIENIKDTELLPAGFSLDKFKTYMSLSNPENGNSIQGESSNKNFSRSGRYKVVLFDEFGFWPDARRSWQAAGDATRCRIAVTTPPDEPSYAKILRFSGKVKVITLHWSKHPKKDQAWYDSEKKRRTDEEVLHELDISWEYSTTGRVYPEADRIQVGEYPYDPSLPLYTSIDLGLDAVALGWYQPVRNSDWLTLVDAYENYDKVIEFFLPFFGKDINTELDFIYNDADLEFIQQVKYWKHGTFYGDPSGKQRHVESGISPYKILSGHKIYVQTNEKENDWKSRRDQTRRIIPKLRVNDTPRTRWFMECLRNARYPKRAEESQNVHPITLPVHDYTSHHRTQLEFFSVNYQPQVEDEEAYAPSWVMDRMRA